MIVLSGDIGGTNTRLQLTKYTTINQHEVIEREKYSGKNFKSLSDIIKKFFSDCNINPQDISSACFAVAGPIVNGTVKFTNLPWFVEEKTLKKNLQLEKVCLINDFQAIGYGIETLEQKDLKVLQTGKAKPKAPRAIIGAGTGLGVALMHFDGTNYKVSPTEGGHVGFAPTDDTQMKLLKYLRKKYHRVSVERIVSGRGLEQIYKFVRDNPLYGEVEHEEVMRAIYDNDDIAATVSFYAAKQDPMCMRGIDLFIRAYGSCVGDLALTTLPFGGMYIVGGIAPKMLTQIVDGRFLECFHDKGRMSNLLKDIPLKVVLDTEIGLQGSAQFAARLVL